MRERNSQSKSEGRPEGDHLTEQRVSFKGYR